MKINEVAAAMGVNVERFIAHWVEKGTILWPKENQEKAESDGPYVYLLQSRAGVWKGCLKNTSSFGQTQFWE